MTNTDADFIRNVALDRQEPARSRLRNIAARLDAFEPATDYAATETRILQKEGKIAMFSAAYGTGRAPAPAPDTGSLRDVAERGVALLEQILQELKRSAHS